MDSSDHKKVTGDYIIAGSELLTGPEVNTQHDKDLTIVIVLPADGDRPKEEVVVAAYDSHEYNKWREALSSVIYPDRSSSRGTRRTTVHGEGEGGGVVGVRVGSVVGVRVGSVMRVRVGVW